MCGFCGYIGSSPDEKVNISEMLRSMSHRGPDSSGTWSDGRVILGHNRLAIIDLSPNGRQPMTRGGLVIVFNGEVYNYLELKTELEESFGQVFLTGTDTEVVMAAWQVWGREALSRFRGMWAFALYNTAANELILCRDRFGIKPLYYFPDSKKFLFASEIKALLAAPDVPRKAFLPVISDYLLAGFQDHRPETFFRGVKQLQPGHCLHLNIKDRSFSIEPYYDLSRQLEGRVSTIEEFGRVFESSIKFHLRSDVPVGTCLSGGLDSSAVATLAAAYIREQEGEAFHAVTARSGDSRNDETEYARRVVEAAGLSWHLSAPAAEDFQEHWQKCLWHQEEPTGGPSIFMQYWVMKTAAQAGIKVMLDGQGGDECLLGYERYYPSVLCYRLSRGALGAVFREFFAATRHSNLSARQLLLYAAYFLVGGVRKRHLVRRLPGLHRELVEETLSRVEESARTYRDTRALQVAEIKYFQLPHLLKYEDRNSMAWSIEARVPFVDHEVIETALALRPEDKINRGFTKWALRKTMDGKMPDEITWRRNKIAFAAPVEQWIKPAESYMRDTINRSVLLKELGASQAPVDMRMFILMFELAGWESMYNVSL